jgi:hypothetical protein
MTANIVLFLRVRSRPRTTVRVGFFFSRYGFNFRATGQKPSRKNKQREKHPAPGAGLIAGQGCKSRQMGWKNGHFEGFWAKNDE